VEPSPAEEIDFPFPLSVALVVKVVAALLCEAAVHRLCRMGFVSLSSHRRIEP
jgi:hypothetical protein